MGMSLLNAQGNSLLSMLHNPTAMGFAHACYGIGALVSPLISTQFASYYDRTQGRLWTLFYTVLIGAALSNIISFATLFKGAGYEEILNKMGVQKQEEIELQNPQSREANNGINADAGGTQPEEGSQSNRDENTFGLVLKQVHVHTLAVFIFIYVGVEVTIGGTSFSYQTNTIQYLWNRLDCDLYDQ
jgi:fucose permease